MEKNNRNKDLKKMWKNPNGKNDVNNNDNIVTDIDKDDLLRVGTYVNTHGVKGEIKVYPHTDDVERFLDLDSFYMDTKKGLIKYEINNVKFFKNMAILKLKGIDNINDIEKYKGSDLLITRDQAVPLEDDEYFICDIIGAKVIADGEEFGVVKDVLMTGANDVYVVKANNGKEVLFPVIPSCITDIDVENHIVTAHIMPGLLDPVE